MARRAAGKFGSAFGAGGFGRRPLPVARIRGQEKFASVGALVDAMGNDTQRARSLLSAT